VVNRAMLDDFKQYVVSRRVTIDEAAWAKDADFIAAMIRLEIDIALFGVATARRHLVEVDPQARYALTLFPEVQKLTELARASVPQK
jgi:hypothetical protein